MGQSLICTILCLIPFLEHDQLENIPSLVAGSIVHLPSRVHGYIIQVLCYYILPLIMSEWLSNVPHPPTYIWSIQVYRREKIHLPCIIPFQEF